MEKLNDNEIVCACRGVCQALGSSMVLEKNPENYEDPRIAVLLEWIEAVGIEETIQAIEMEPGKKIVIVGKDGVFMATGPGVVFITMLPKEAFEGLRRE